MSKPYKSAGLMDVAAHSPGGNSSKNLNDAVVGDFPTHTDFIVTGIRFWEELESSLPLPFIVNGLTAIGTGRIMASS